LPERPDLRCQKWRDRLTVIYTCKHLVRQCIDNLAQSYTRRYSHHH